MLLITKGRKNYKHTHSQEPPPLLVFHLFLPSLLIHLFNMCIVVKPRGSDLGWSTLQQWTLYAYSKRQCLTQQT